MAQFYNRFSGNPPAGLTADQAYIAENGALPAEVIDPQAIQGEIDTLTTRVSTLETKVAALP